MTLHYNVGLDIGTNSVGYTIVDDNGKILQVKGKNGYGVRVFKEGATAAERRIFRTTHRRLKRRKWRLRLLQDFFEPYILPQDDGFFIRRKESNLVLNDRDEDTASLFNDRSDRDFYQAYPTIYHLRQALMTEKRQFDVREIYLAMHHIIKYRGHFLLNGTVNNFTNNKIDLHSDFEELNALLLNVIPELKFQIDLDHSTMFQTTLLNTTISRSGRQRDLVKSFYNGSDDKQLAKQQKSVATELLKAILGLKAKFHKLFNLDLLETTEWEFSFDAEDIDDKLAKLEPLMTENQQQVMDILQRIFAAITLNGIVPEGKTLSASKVDSYQKHKQDLKLLKAIAQHSDKKTATVLQTAYNEYINGIASKPLKQEDFYKRLTNAVKKSSDPQVADMLALIDQEKFLPKQRTKENGAIPHQLHQLELERIIDNQKDYYPWLAELNPNQARQKVAKYKLSELVAFRVPYYVGPLIEPEVQQATSNAHFAWMARKEAGPITPWNFDQKVDRNVSAERFIKRMTTKDTYLLAEDVLPLHSLLYQRFIVLNELNNVRVNGQKLTKKQKQAVYQDLFKRQPHVTKKQFKSYLVQTGEFAESSKIEGLANETSFNSGLTTENELRKIFGVQLDEARYQVDFEQIIEWATLFEDAKILRTKLAEITWLTTEQIEKLAGIRYRGWGRFSRKLLAGLRDQNGQQIIDLLWDTPNNFMVIVSQAAFSEAITKENEKLIDRRGAQDVITDLYTSPQNKKALRQVLAIVADVQKAMGGVPPQRIFIEFAREDEKNPRRSVERSRQLEKLYQTISNEFLINSEVRQELKEAVDQKVNFKDRLFLYFLQGGVDLYSGKRINIDQLSHYDIDHILPQSFIKDDSLDNRVLVSQKLNRSKSDSVPLSEFANYKFGPAMQAKWLQLKEAGLLSKRKYDNLTLDPTKLSKFAPLGFVNRQLVETRQVIKLAANLLASEETKVVTIKANMTHQVRKELDFPKNRNVNNYHHAFDAYLTAFVGIFLSKRYPKLKPYFTYGDFQKGNKLPDLKNFNFLYELKNKDRSIDSNTGEIIWDKQRDLAYMNKIYNFKKVTVVHEVLTKSGALYNQTLYKASEDKASGRGTKQLIRKKDNMPTELYGGYTGSTSAFMSIVRLWKKDKPYYKVVGIPTRMAAKLANQAQLLDYLTKEFTTRKLVKKTGDYKTTVERFELVVPKIGFNQLVIDGGQPFMLGSATYKYNARELVISKESIKALDEISAHIDLLQVFDEILEQVNQWFPLYDTNKFRAKLSAGRSKYTELTDFKSKLSEDKEATKISILNNILTGLHANASFGDLKSLGISTPFGFIQQQLGITLTEAAILVHQSPSGLFERKVALRDLKGLR